MFSYQYKKGFVSDNIEKDFTLFINESTEIQCNRLVASGLSNVIRLFLKQNRDASKFDFFIDELDDIALFESLFWGKEIQFNTESIPFLLELSKTLEIDSLYDQLIIIQNNLYELRSVLKSNETMKSVCKIENNLICLSENSFESLTEEIIESSVDNSIICKLIISSCIARPNLIELYIQLLININKIQLENNEIIIIGEFRKIIIEMFKMSIKTFKSFNEIFFIIQLLIENNMLDECEIQKVPELPLFFAHLMPESRIKFLEFSSRNSNWINDFKKNKENNFTLHKKYIHEGINQDPIAILLRHDDVDNFQKLLYENFIDINSLIKYSIYERSEIVCKDVTFLEYSAFFGSIKCFRFLLMNNATISNNLMCFAVAGGNIEIIKLCEQKNCSLDNCLIFSIRYHHWKLFDWLIASKSQNSWENPELIIECFKSNNFKSLSKLLKIGYNPSKILIEATKSHIAFMVKIILQLSTVDVNFKDNHCISSLQYACKYNYIDLVKMFITHPSIDINCKNNFENNRVYKILFNMFLCKTFIVFYFKYLWEKGFFLIFIMNSLMNSLLS